MTPLGEKPLGRRGPDLEARPLEVAVEGEGPAQLLLGHEREGDAVGEAYLLVGEFLENIDGLALLPLSRPKDFKRLGAQYVTGSLRGDPAGFEAEYSWWRGKL